MQLRRQLPAAFMAYAYVVYYVYSYDIILSYPGDSVSLSELFGEKSTSDICIKLGATLSILYPHIFHQCRVNLFISGERRQ